MIRGFTPLSVELYLIPAVILMTVMTAGIMVFLKLGDDPRLHLCDECGDREALMMLGMAAEMMPAAIALQVLLRSLGWPVTLAVLVQGRREQKAEHAQHVKMRGR